MRATYALDLVDAVLADFDARPEVAALLAQCRAEGHVPAEWRRRWFCDRCGDPVPAPELCPDR